MAQKAAVPPSRGRPYELIDRHALNAPVEAERSIDALAEYLTRPATTDRDRARAIFRWITDRIAYNAEAFLAGTPVGDCSAEAVLRSRKTVCAGYANLFEQLARQAGLDAVKISGYAKGFGYVPGEKLSPNHAWNAVKIEEQWRLVDSTWGAGMTDAAKGFVKQLNEQWFLTSPEQMILSHFPDDPARQFLPLPIDAETFRRWPKVPDLLSRARLCGQGCSGRNWRRKTFPDWSRCTTPGETRSACARRRCKRGGACRV